MLFCAKKDPNENLRFSGWPPTDWCHKSQTCWCFHSFAESATWDNFGNRTCRSPRLQRHSFRLQQKLEKSVDEATQKNVGQTSIVRADKRNANANRKDKNGLEMHGRNKNNPSSQKFFQAKTKTKEIKHKNKTPSSLHPYSSRKTNSNNTEANKQNSCNQNNKTIEKEKPTRERENEKGLQSPNKHKGDPCYFDARPLHPHLGLLHPSPASMHFCRCPR